MAAPLKAAVIGLGWAGSVHARVLRALDGVELIAVADTDPRRRSAFPGLLAVASIDDLLRTGMDYCVVATPTASHEPIGLSLAAAGVHALIEKPLASSLPAALALAGAFERAGLLGAAGHTERHNPAIRHVASRLQDGGLGAVYQISTRRQGPFPRRIRDVGVVTDLAIHDVDLAAWLTGAAITSVSARVSHLTGRPHEDLASALCQLASGQVTSHQVNWISPLKERLLIVHGAAGCLIADALTGTVTLHANGEAAAGGLVTGPFPGVSSGPVTTCQPTATEPFVAQHQAFRDALLGRPSQTVTLCEGAAAVAAAEAILTSAHTGAAVPPARLPADPARRQDTACTQ
jgi:predicted dehydrogenase